MRQPAETTALCAIISRSARSVLVGERVFTASDLAKAEKHRDELRGAEWHRLRELASALPEPALIELTALMWFGQGDDDFKSCLALAKQTSDDRDGDLN